MKQLRSKTTKEIKKGKRARWKLFLRSFAISFFVLICVIGGLAGAAIADRNSREVGFADNQPAISVDCEEGRLYVSFFGYEFEFEIDRFLPPRRIWMQPVGQASAQASQPVHSPESTDATKSLTVTAPVGQTLTHFMQPMQPAVHCLRVVPPFS